MRQTRQTHVIVPSLSLAVEVGDAEIDDDEEQHRRPFYNPVCHHVRRTEDSVRISLYIPHESS